ncbi:ATP-binding protein [Metapseudomonas lalkuanensis]|uniref:ATP-binding protein n=1 Tax=Metapseudomonas lalkuanensis TaxID=2604832 RepID=A0A5J6QRH9_9GAMM|nr:ATP-binding protein [Pseudomonas lalkuanensis]QEY64997.1 ATP-binding protein [Pseudomonas lalkuanensis]
MCSKTVRAAGPHSDDISPLTLSWIFTLMLDLGGHRQLIGDRGFNDDALAHELGVAELEEQFEGRHFSFDEDEEDEPRPKRARSFRQQAVARLKTEQRLFLHDFPTPSYPDNLGENLFQLTQLIGLDEIDRALLGFCVLMHSDALLEEATDQLGQVGFNRTLRVLSTLLSYPPEAIRRHLSADSALVRTGLIEVSMTRTYRSGLIDRLGIGNKDLLQDLRFHKGSPIGLFQSAFRRAPKGELSAEDYRHLALPLSIARPYLKRALTEGTPGVNVLIYGPPGTGKSQLTRLLASELSAELYEIACTNGDGDPIDSRGRLCALRTAMGILNQQATLLVLDEIEDLFSEPGTFSPDQGNRKGWINRMLEENSLPCFWLTNNIQALDNAYIRRFDLLLELENPPKAERERIIRKSGGQLTAALIQRMAGHEHLTPAVVTRALRVAESVRVTSDAPAMDQAVEYLVDATLQAQGFDKLARIQEQQLPAFYSPEQSNTDVPLAGLLEGLQHNRDARLCFYGPPGTGKTAFGHWLAREIGRPLLIKRVSDLVSPYIGMTEKNLARAFQQAREDDAVLLLDEVDSFLQERRHARHSWEITAVNEMLMQMENHRGLLIASTNLMDDLDQAALRRFDLKISFGYLRPEQASELLHLHLEQMGLDTSNTELDVKVKRLERLTPGDFATLARRARFRPFADADAYYHALLSELALKEAPPSRPIGFVH